MKDSVRWRDVNFISESDMDNFINKFGSLMKPHRYYGTHNPERTLTVTVTTKEDLRKHISKLTGSREAADKYSNYIYSIQFGMLSSDWHRVIDECGLKYVYGIRWIKEQV